MKVLTSCQANRTQVGVKAVRIDPTTSARLYEFTYSLSSQ